MAATPANSLIDIENDISDILSTDVSLRVSSQIPSITQNQLIISPSHSFAQTSSTIDPLSGLEAISCAGERNKFILFSLTDDAAVFHNWWTQIIYAIIARQRGKKHK